jgi:hypothetical protein
MITTTDVPRQAEHGLDALDEISRELSQYVALTDVSKHRGWNLGRLHRARLTGKLECTKILGRWCTTPAAVRGKLAQSRSATASTKLTPGARTEAARKAGADAAMAEIRSLTS